jgi:hypothetical protein
MGLYPHFGELEIKLTPIPLSPFQIMAYMIYHFGEIQTFPPSPNSSTFGSVIIWEWVAKVCILHGEFEEFKRVWESEGTWVGL